MRKVNEAQTKVLIWWESVKRVSEWVCVCVCVCVWERQRGRGGRRETEIEQELFLVYCVLANTKKEKNNTACLLLLFLGGFPKSYQYTDFSHAIHTRYYIKILICQIVKSEVRCYTVMTGLQQNMTLKSCITCVLAKISEVTPSSCSY